MKRFRTWWKRLMIVVVLLLAVLVSVAACILLSEQVRLKLLAYALPRLETASGLTVVLENPSWPRLGTMGVERLSLGDDDGTWLAVQEVSIACDLRALADKQIRISSLAVFRMDLLARPTGMDRSRRKPSTAAPWPVTIDQWVCEHLRVDPAVAGIPLRASMAGSAAYDDTGWRGNLDLSKGRVDRFPFALSLRGRGDDESISWSDLVLTTEGVHIDSQGTVMLPDIAWDAAANIRATDARRVARWLNVPLTGEGELQVAGTGTTTQGRLTWTASLPAAGWHMLSITGLSSAGAVEYGDGTWVSTGMVLTAAAIDVSGTSITGVDAFAVVSTDAVEGRAAAALQGSRPVHASTGFIVQRPFHPLIIDVSSLIAKSGESFPPVQLQSPMHIRQKDETWYMDPVHVAAGPLTLQGSVSGAGDVWETTGEGRLATLDFMPWVTNRGVDVDSTFHWDFRGLPFAPAGELAATLTPSVLESDESGQWLPRSIDALVHITTQDVHAAVSVEDNGRYRLDAHASVPYHMDRSTMRPVPDDRRSLTGRVEASTTLSALADSILSEWQRVEGDVAGDLVIGGTWDAPELVGELVVTNGIFEDPARGIVVDGLHGVASSINGTSFVVRVEGRDGVQGQLSATGYVSRSGMVPVWQGRADFKRFIAGRVLSSDLPVDGTLRLTGTGAVLAVTGRIDLAPVELQLPRRLPPSIRELDVVEHGGGTPPARAAAPSQQAKPVAISVDIDIAAQQGVKVTGNSLRSDWAGRGKVTGVIPNIQAGGTIRLLRGSLIFLGRRFQMDEGEILIPSGGYAHPVISLQARTRAAGAAIYLRVSGPADEPVLELSSDPVMPRNEIVSRLLFGKPGSEVSPWQLAYLAYALDVARGGRPLLEQLDRGRLLPGVDQISVTQSEEEAGVAGVSFGKQLHDRVYLESEMMLNNEPDVIAVEAELTPSLILRTETSPRIREGISIHWRHDY